MTGVRLLHCEKERRRRRESDGGYGTGPLCLIGLAKLFCVCSYSKIDNLVM